MKWAGTRRVPRKEGGRSAGPRPVLPPGPSGRPATLATEPIIAVPRHGVLHGARLLAAASPRGPGLRVGGCHWSAGAGAPAALPPLARRRGSCPRGGGHCGGVCVKRWWAARGRTMWLNTWKTTQKMGRVGRLWEVAPACAAKRCRSTDGLLLVRCRCRTKLQIKIPFKRCLGHKMSNSEFNKCQTGTSDVAFTLSQRRHTMN